MRRFYLTEIAGEYVEIEGNEAEHISRVLRMQPGDALVLFDGSGTDYEGEILDVGAKRVRLKILSKRLSEREPDVDVTLYQATVKNDKFDFIVQKCTELGVGRIVPFVGARCVKKPKDGQKFVERARRIALEAAKQSGRSRVPEIADIMDFSRLPEEPVDGISLVAYENEMNTTLKQALDRDKKENISIMIGPEGGFEEGEIARLQQHGVQAVSLGRLTLRAETAGMAALAMILYEYGD